MKKTSPLCVFVISEANLARLFWYILCGARPLVLFENALLLPFRRPLQRLTGWLADRGWIRTLEHFGPDLPWLPVLPLERNLTQHVFPAVEAGLRESYRIAEPGPTVEPYLYAMCKALSDYTDKIKDLIYLAEWIEETLGHGHWVAHGWPRHFDVMYGLLRGCAPPFLQNKVFVPRQLANGLNALLSFLAGTVWLVRRTRLHQPPAESFRIIVDRGGADDAYLYRHLVDDPKELLIVDRNREIAAANAASNGAFRSCLKEDARIGVAAALRLVTGLFRDLAAIWWKGGGTDPALFGRYAVLAPKRAMFAAFFRCFRPRFFWGRDDYSIDHIIRNQELRKIGGKALGINHGIPLSAIISQWREVDFDIYYSYGRHMYEAVNKSHWAKHIQIKPVGTINLTREHRQRLHQPRPPDIAFFPTVQKGFDRIFQEAFKVATHFPDRRFYIKMKPGRPRAYVDRYKRLMNEAPANVIAYIDNDAYELLMEVSYALCFSTLVAEALCFRVKTFCLQSDDSLEHFYYRHFPELVAADGDAVIRRIEAIENGTESFDFERFEELINVNAPDLIDVVRADIGLVPNGGG